MTMEQLRKAVQAEPFRPFSVSLTDGHRFHVRDRDYIWVPPQASRTFGVAVSGEDYSIIDLLLVTSLDFKSPRSPRRNGR